MNNGFKGFIKSTQTMLKKHSPEILMAVGIVGMFTTIGLAVKATPPALKLIEEEKKRLNAELREEAKQKNWDVVGQVDKLKPIDVIKTTWKCYIPTAVVGTMSTICLIGSNSINTRRNAALVTAYTLSETALKEYQSKVVETIGEKKEQLVRDSIAEDKLRANPVTSREVIITERGNTLCYDVLSGRYFKSDKDKLEKAANELNRQMRSEMYISLNEWYYEIGINGTKMGEDLGWNIEDGYIDLGFSSLLADDGTPCLVVDYMVAPKYDFQH